MQYELKENCLYFYEADGDGGGGGGGSGGNEDNIDADDDTDKSMSVDSSVHLYVITGVKKTPLHIASVKGDIAKIRLLIDLRASAMFTDPDGNTLYHLAAREHCTDILKVRYIQRVW